LSIDSLIGYWEPNKHATQLVLWKDIKGQLQVVEFSTIDGMPLRLLYIKIINNTLVIKSIFDEKNWVTECNYTLINDNILECAVKGPINDIVIYTKIK
jgi:hypothetical protein